MVRLSHVFASCLVGLRRSLASIRACFLSRLRSTKGSLWRCYAGWSSFTGTGLVAIGRSAPSHLMSEVVLDECVASHYGSGMAAEQEIAP